MNIKFQQNQTNNPYSCACPCKCSYFFVLFVYIYLGPFFVTSCFGFYEPHRRFYFSIAFLAFFFKFFSLVFQFFCVFYFPVYSFYDVCYQGFASSASFLSAKSIGSTPRNVQILINSWSLRSLSRSGFARLS